MLAWARQQVGKSFSNIGMARSLVWPRQTDGSSFFCAELVAAALKVGGLLSLDSNPGAATPHSLFKMYSRHAAATANPYTLRAVQGLTMASMRNGDGARVPLLGGGEPAEASSAAPARVVPGWAVATGTGAFAAGRRRADSPPRASFRLLNVGGAQPSASAGFALSLDSLSSSRAPSC